MTRLESIAFVVLLLLVAAVCGAILLLTRGKELLDAFFGRPRRAPWIARE